SDPDGLMFGTTKAHKSLREKLEENHKLEAIISMPGGVCKPYAGVSTANDNFAKTEAGGTDDVWYHDMQADGFSLDDKRKPIEANDIPDILARFHSLEAEKDRKRTEQSFFVDKASIVEQGYDLSINRYKEIVYEKVEYDPPAVILDRIEKLNKDRVDLDYIGQVVAGLHNIPMVSKPEKDVWQKSNHQGNDAHGRPGNIRHDDVRIDKRI